jgi:hypothetical protein
MKGVKGIKGTWRVYFPGVAVVLSLLLVAAVRSAVAQSTVGSNRDDRKPILIDLKLGMGVANHDSRCISSVHITPGLEILTRGKLFVSMGIEGMLGGPTEDCLVLPLATTLPDGRVLVRGDERLDIGVGGHFVIGVGVRRSRSNNTYEGKIELGVARAREDYPGEALPSIGGSLAAITLGNHFLLSFEQRWFRTPNWEKTYSAAEWTENPPSRRPAGATTIGHWTGYSAFMFGVRF